MLVVALTLIPLSSHAAPFFEFSGSGQPGDFISGGQSYFRNQAFGTSFPIVVDLTGDGQPDYLDIYILGNTQTQAMIVTIGTNQLGQNLHTGTYSNAERAPFASAGHPGLDIALDGRGCNILTGSFVIYDVAFAPGNVLDRLDVTFEQHCEGASPAFIGRFRYDRSNPLSSLATAVPTLGPIGLPLLATLIAALFAVGFCGRAFESLSGRSSRVRSRSPDRESEYV